MKNKVVDRLPLKSERESYRQKRARQTLKMEKFFFFLLFLLIVSLVGLWICQEVELSYVRAILVRME